MTSELKVVINGDGSGAARALGVVSGGITGLTGIITGGLSVAFGNILTPVLQNLQGVFGSFLTEAMDAQNNLAGLDAVLKATGQAAADQATQWEAAQGKIVTTSGLSKEKTDELTLSQRQLLNQIAGTTDGLAKLAAEHGTDNTVYQEGALKLEVLKNKLAQVNGELEAGQPRAVSLASALGLTPPAAQMSREALLDLSMQLRDLAGGSDDAVLGVETVLTRMGVAKDVFPDATKAVLDVAAALKIDLGSAATLVGKTLLAPGEGLAKLKVAGAVFTKQQDEMLKKMVDAGKTAEAQKFILDTLAQTMGGTAAEKAQTFSGQLEIARNHLLEIAEGVGAKFLPMLQGAFATVTPLIDFFGAQIEKYLPVVMLTFQNLAPHVEQFAGALAGLLGVDFSGFDLEATIQSLVVWFGQAMNGVGQFLDRLSSLVADLEPAREALSKLFEALANNDPAAFTAALDGLGTAIQNLWSETIQPALTTLVNKIGSWLGEQGPALADNLQSWGNEIGSWLMSKLPGPVQAGLLTAFQVIGDVFSAIGATLGPTLAPLQEALGQLFTTLEPLGQVLVPVLQGIGVALAAVLLAVVAVITGIIDGIVTAMTFSLPFVQMAVQGLVVIFDGVKNYFSALMDGVKALFAGDWSGLVDAIGRMNLAVLEILGGLLYSMASMIGASLAGISGLVWGFVTGVYDFFNNLYMQLVGASIVPDMMNAILSIVTSVLALVNTAWQTGWNTALTTITTVWESIKTGVTTKITELTTNIQTGVNNIIGWMKGMQQTFIDIGVAWFEGIKLGILLKVGQLQEAVIGAIKDTIALARKALDMSSPSGVFKEIGENMMAGMALGISGGVNLPTAAIATNTAALTQQAAAFGGGVGGGGREQGVTISINQIVDGIAFGRTTVEGTLKALAERGVDVEAMLAVGAV